MPGINDIPSDEFGLLKDSQMVKDLVSENKLELIYSDGFSDSLISKAKDAVRGELEYDDIPTRKKRRTKEQIIAESLQSVPGIDSKSAPGLDITPV
jgi:hypothetical protein